MDEDTKMKVLNESFKAQSDNNRELLKNHAKKQNEMNKLLDVINTNNNNLATIVEKDWNNWTTQDVCDYVILKVGKELKARNVKPEEILNKLKEQEITGEFLPHMHLDTSIIHNFGVTVLPLKLKLQQHFKRIVKKYPLEKTNNTALDTEEGDSEITKAPSGTKNLKALVLSKYTCSLYKSILQKPVKFILDDQIYEKESILQFLAKYLKSPTNANIVLDKRYKNNKDLIIENCLLCEQQKLEKECKSYFSDTPINVDEYNKERIEYNKEKIQNQN